MGETAAPPLSQSGTTVTLSTGHTVELPLECEFTMAGALFGGAYSQLNECLPSSRLTPIRIGIQRGLVALVDIEYSYVGGLKPYNEFAVIIPVTCDAPVDAPLVQLFGGDLGGYVHYLPVTTEESVALGREIWGYPKEVADITTTEQQGIRRITVAKDGEEILRLTVRRAAGRDRELTMHSYTVQDAQLIRTRTEVAGDVAIRPFRQQPSYTLGEHPRADELRRLGIGEQSLGRLFGTQVSARIFPGKRSPRSLWRAHDHTV